MAKRGQGARRAAGPAADAPLIAVAANDAWNIANHRAPLLRALAEAGFRVVAMAPDGPFAEQVRRSGVPFEPIPLEARGVSAIRDFRTIRAYRRTLRRLRPAAFLGFTAKPNIYGSLAAQSLGIPVLNNISGLGATFINGGPLRLVVSTLYRAALRRSAIVFFQNPDDRAEFERGGLVRPRQARLLPGSGVDLDHFKPGLRKRNPGPMTFLLPARMLWAKGVAEFAEAARQLTLEGLDARFQLLGPIEPASGLAVPEPDIQRWCADGILEYLGSTKDVREAFAGADCIVLPSYREGVPRVLLEGAAMGIPAVATDVPGCRHAVEAGRTGILCDARSAASLADAIRTMAKLGSTERLAMGKAARARMEARFSADFVHRSYLDELAKLGIAGG